MKLNPIFTSGMVFAADQPIRIYGEGCGEAVVTFAGQTENITAVDNKWLIEFPAMEYGGPYSLTFASDNKEIVLDDIYIGEVYLFAGQSNMQFKLHGSTTDPDTYKTNDKLRMFSTDRLEEGEPFNPRDGWIKCTKENAKDWSAIGYLTSIELVERKNIAVGIITAYQGASAIESWVPEGTFESFGTGVPPEQRHGDHYSDLCKKWNGDGALYNYVLSQIIPFSLTGVIWYQGESDTSLEESREYKNELTAMINVWRKDFKNDKLPFVIIQIADFDLRDDEAWHNVQKAQLEIQNELDCIKTVISADICESDNIHPPTKDKLSHRVAEALLSF